MKKRYLLICLLMLCCFLPALKAQAQLVPGEMWKNKFQGNVLDELKNRILLVSLQDDDPMLSDKLRKKSPEVAAALEKKRELFNQNTKTAIEKVWKLEVAGIKYVSLNEIKELTKGDDYYKYATISIIEIVGVSFGMVARGDKKMYVGGYYPLPNRLLLWASDTKIQQAPSAADIAYTFMKIQKSLQGRPEKSSEEVKMYGKKLQEKTLLLDVELLTQGLDERAIREAYPYNFKLVSKDEVEKAILSRDPSAAYIVFLYDGEFAIGPVAGQLFWQEVISAEDATTLAVSITKMTSRTGDSRISLPNIKRYLECAQGE